jgi:outer membrane protein assembly factor BamB
MWKRSFVVLFAVAISACSWGQFRGGAEHAGSQPFENRITAANVSSLQARWTTSAGGVAAVAGGVQYIGEGQALLAFDAGGTSGCSGSPKTCSPLWSGAVPFGEIASTPAVADGIVYIANQTIGVVWAFDAAGATGCSGVPKSCKPLWIAKPSVGTIGSVSVAGGAVYISGGDGKLYAFDAAGVTNCNGASPRFCDPLWSATTGAQVAGTPAVAGGVVYVASSDDHLYAFDASGHTGCSGVPKTCAPLWTAPVSVDLLSDLSPAVVDGVVYFTGGGGSVGVLSAFDATGHTGCSGVPKTCKPLWTATTSSEFFSNPAIAGHTVYVSDADATLYAFDAAGVTGCSGAPKSCAPMWTAPAAGDASPSVANGVVYVAGSGRLRAFDAAGATGCSGAPKHCSPLWTSSATGAGGDAAVANGTVFTGDAAFGLPS